MDLKYRYQNGGNRHFHEMIRHSTESSSNRTYRLPESLIANLTATAKHYQVGVSDLAMHLLRDGLERLESGEFKLATRSLPLQIIEAIQK